MKIRINQYAFELSEPFQTGHSLSANEAQALNSLRAENIRNNVAKRVREELAILGDGELLSLEQIKELQALVDRHSERYRFPSRHTASERLGPLEAEIKRLATLKAQEQAQNASGYYHDWENRLPELELDPQIREQARKNVEAGQMLAKQALAELLG